MTTTDATPHAASLIQSLRDIGYSSETAPANILDSSTTSADSRLEDMTHLSAADQTVEDVAAWLSSGSKTAKFFKLPQHKSFKKKWLVVGKPFLTSRRQKRGEPITPECNRGQQVAVSD